MIVTPDGPRMLTGHSRRLVRGTVGMMLDWLVAECRGQCGQWVYGIDWFDQWEAPQRIWLIEVVTKSFLTTLPPPPRWAIFEATVDAMLAELRGLVQMEINQTEVTDSDRSWREQIISCIDPADHSGPLPGADSSDINVWHATTQRWMDRITGPLSYIDAERYRDGDPNRCRDYLLHRGLPDDFLLATPPMRTIDQTQLSIDRIQNLVFEDS